MLGPYLRSLIKTFSASLDKSLSEAFRPGSIEAPFHADAAVDGIKLRLLKGAALDDEGGSTKSADVVEPPADTEVIES